MANGFGTDVVTMHQAAQRVRDVNQSIQSELSSLQGRLEPLASNWQGAAFVTFQRLMARWNTDAAKLNDALAHIADAIDVTKGTYQRRDEQSSDSLSAIASALG